MAFYRLRTLAVMLAAYTIAAPKGRAQSDSTWRDHEQALQAARTAHDTVIYRAQLDAIHRMIGTTPRIGARFAGLALGAHDKAESRRWMGALAAMGVPLDSTLLAQYSTLAGAGARDALLAQRARATSDIGAPEIVHALPDPNMIAEDIAWDAARSRLLVSSVHNGSIYAMRIPGGTVARASFSTESSWGIFALGVDSVRNVLWAVTAAIPMTARYSAADSGRSALLEFNLQTGALLTRFLPPDSGAHAFGDLVVASNGAVYVSDGLGTGVYALDSGSSALRTLVPRGVLLSPQTPAIASDGTTLLVPDYSIGIAAVSIATGAVTWIAHSDSLALSGIDGMYRIGRDLMAVQNGLEPNRIVRLTLDAQMHRVLRVTTIVRGSAASDINHATIARGWLYFLRKSGWSRVADDGTMSNAAQVDGPQVVRVRPSP